MDPRTMRLLPILLLLAVRSAVAGIQATSVQLVSSSRRAVTLRCHVEAASGGGPLEVEWFRDGGRLGALRNIERRENRLVIRSPGPADSGLYRCVAANAAGRVMSAGGYALKWTESGKSAAAALNCAPRLRRNHASPDALKQTFLCRGKRGGPAGDPLPAAEVRITRGPPARLVVNESEPAELPCAFEAADGLPGASVLHWRKDGKLLRQVELDSSAGPAATTVEPNKDLMLREDARLSLSRQNGSLLFSSVLGSDAGLYVCQVAVEGRRPATSAAGELQVVEQLKFAPQPTSKNLELGSLAKVHCKAQGTPPPHVSWISERGDGQRGLPDGVDDVNGTLVFRSVAAEQRGNYTCVAASSQGRISATVSVNVVVAPRFSVAPEGPVETAEMGVAAMHCQATGDPRPTIQWDKDLQYLSENNTDRRRFSFLANGTLVIRDVQLDDEGRYGCTIGNSAGLKREEVRFVVKPGEGAAGEEAADGPLITRAVLITMSVAFAYIVLVVGLTVWCRCRRRARKARLGEAHRASPESGGDDGVAGGERRAEHEPCLPVESKSRRLNGNNNPRGGGGGGGGGEAQRSDDTACSNQSRGSRRSNAFEQLSLPRAGLVDLIQVGRGEFGDVFVGRMRASLIRPAAEDRDREAEAEKQSGSETAAAEKRRSKTSMDDIEEIREEPETGSSDADTVTAASAAAEELRPVMVKALNRAKDELLCQEFRRQIEMFRALSHRGVVRLFGLCRDKDPHFMVLEYTDWGDLKQFLLATAGKVSTATNAPAPPPLKTGQVLAAAYQIARGMDALYRARFIHKDLAARNCVISSEFVVKVSYPALCKDKYSREYWRHRNALLPVRWLAPECLQEDEYTTKSDIFAFGVVVWELFLQATRLPFEELSNEEVLRRGQAAELDWQCPAGVPDGLRPVLVSCWSANPKERPSFSQLCSALSKAIQQADQ